MTTHMNTMPRKNRSTNCKPTNLFGHIVSRSTSMRAIASARTFDVASGAQRR